MDPETSELAERRLERAVAEALTLSEGPECYSIRDSVSPRLRSTWDRFAVSREVTAGTLLRLLTDVLLERQGLVRSGPVAHPLEVVLVGLGVVAVVGVPAEGLGRVSPLHWVRRRLLGTQRQDVFRVATAGSLHGTKDWGAAPGRPGSPGRAVRGKAP